MSFAFRALGTQAVIAYADPAARNEAVALVAAELDAVDRACSRFREDSELTQVVRAGGRPVEVSTLLLDAVDAALDAARDTDGLVDPTVGRTLRLAGYDSTFSVVAARDARRFHARYAVVPGWRVVEVDRGASTVRVPRGVELDLGATAKALAADRCAARAAAACGCGILVSLGGDVAVAGDPPDGGWPVGIADHHAERAVATVAIRSGGLATSSTAVRRWQSGRDALHHVIDPRTGRPAVSWWRTVSVAARTCLDANVASTAAIVLGPEALDWLKLRGLDARLADKDGGVQTTCRWPAEAVHA